MSIPQKDVFNDQFFNRGLKQWYAINIYMYAYIYPKFLNPVLDTVSNARRVLCMQKTQTKIKNCTAIPCLPVHLLNNLFYLLNCFYVS